jgi:hypothetical protein
MTARRREEWSVMARSERDGPIPAAYMSTHAIKTELRSLLDQLAPTVGWSKHASVTRMSDWALHHLDAGSSDPRVRRARELASVIYHHERR